MKNFLKGLVLFLVLDWMFGVLVRVAYAFGGMFWVCIFGLAVSVVALLAMIFSNKYRLISFLFCISGLVVAVALV